MNRTLNAVRSTCSADVRISSKYTIKNSRCLILKQKQMPPSLPMPALPPQPLIKTLVELRFLLSEHQLAVHYVSSK